MWRKLQALGVAAFALTTLAAARPAVPQQDVVKLRIGLYPYAPRQERFEAVIRSRWERKHPEVKLEFLTAKEWDAGYDKEPPEDTDVFEVDAISLEHFTKNNFASRLRLEELDNPPDFFEFALRGSMVDGTLYGIPRLTCTPVLLYRKGDTAVKDAKGMHGLFQVFGVSDSKDPRPPSGKGLMIDLSSSTMCSLFYLDGVADLTGVFTNAPRLSGPDALNLTVIGNLRKLTHMAGTKQALHEGAVNDRAQWFAEGSGRGYVGWTEQMGRMPPRALESIAFRELPLGEANKVSLLFVDTLLLNSTLQGKRRALALELANLCASSETVTECLLPESTEVSPQYLLPARKSVLFNRKLRDAAPHYEDLAKLFPPSGRPVAFRLGADAREWLAANKRTIRQVLTTE